MKPWEAACELCQAVRSRVKPCEAVSLRQVHQRTRAGPVSQITGEKVVRGPFGQQSYIKYIYSAVEDRYAPREFRCRDASERREPAHRLGEVLSGPR